MVRSLISSRLLAALFALLVGLLSLTPALDAVACAPEAGTSHAAADPHGDGELHEPGDEPADGSGHGVCAHGHCHHHSPSAAPTSMAVDHAAYAVGSRPARPGDEAAASREPDGLLRPPRG